MYAETIGFESGKPYDVAASESESVKLLSATAKETGTWLLGGAWPISSVYKKVLTRSRRRLNPRTYVKWQYLQHRDGVLAKGYAVHRELWCSH